MIMRFSPTILTTIFTLLQWHKSTAASVTFFTDKAAWKEAVGSTNFIVETFEDLPDEFTPSDGGSVRLPNDTPIDFGTEGIEYISTVGGGNPGVANMMDKNKNGLVFESPVDGSDWLFVRLKNPGGDFRDWQMKSTTSFPIAAFSLDYVHIAGASQNVLRMITDTDASEDFTVTSGTPAFLGAIFDPPTFQIAIESVKTDLRGNFDNFQFHFDSCLDDNAKTESGICGCGVADVDSDNDGTPDCIDGCEDDPLKTEPGICGCGVTDIDSDNDGTLDCDDVCEDDPLKTEPGICGCGVADIDSDNDGTVDCDDFCEDDPLKSEPGICGCGVSDIDSDNDGTPDCIDGCINDPVKLEPGICGCGFTDIDSDNDGAPDCIDGCEDDPLKTEPGTCGCGSPDIDSDNNGIPDCIEEELDEEDECGVLFKRNCK